MIDAVDLSLTGPGNYEPGRGFVVRALWLCVEALVLLNPLNPSSALKVAVLRLFGAQIGRDVLIKMGVHVKHPWRLKVGDHCWIGERVWIDNLVSVSIGDHVCVSQGAYLCTGNHDWSDPGMTMRPAPITLARGCWIGAFARVGPGVTVGTEAVLTLGTVLTTDAEPRSIYTPAATVLRGERAVRSPNVST